MEGGFRQPILLPVQASFVERCHLEFEELGKTIIQLAEVIREGRAVVLPVVEFRVSPGPVNSFENGVPALICNFNNLWKRRERKRFYYFAIITSFFDTN